MDWTKKDEAKARYWDKFDPLNVAEAACLWEGVWPDDYDVERSLKGLLVVNGRYHNISLAERLIEEETHKGHIICAERNHYVFDEDLLYDAEGTLTLETSQENQKSIDEMGWPDFEDTLRRHVESWTRHKTNLLSVCSYRRDALIALATTYSHFPLTLFPGRRPKVIADGEGDVRSTILPDYLDKNHVHFAPELEAAVSAWNALFVKKGFKSNRGVKEQIREWLEANRAELSDAAKDRISTVCNFNKSGGAPSTEK